MLSEIGEKLIDALRGRVDEHTYIGLMLDLNGAGLPREEREKYDSDKSFKKMLDYLITNPKANQSDIMRQHRVIMGLPSYEEVLPNKKYALT